MSEFRLKANARIFEGWTSSRVVRSMTQLAHSFAIGIADQWQDDEIPIAAGDAAKIDYQNKTYLNGWIISVDNEYSATSDTVSIVGASKTIDLVECSAIHGTSGQWRNRGLKSIAEDLCRPFGITVRQRVNLGANFRKFGVQDGETVFQCLERAARMRNVLMLTDADGNLYFDRAATNRISTTIERGKESTIGKIVSGRKSVRWSERFSEYRIKTQLTGDSEFFGAACSIKKSTTDAAVERYRPLIISAENEDSGTELQERVDWERNVRAGRSMTITYKVLGWEHETGLWEPNVLVPVRDKRNRIDQELLIVSATQVRDQNGKTTDLELGLPEAFTVQPLPPPKQKEKLW